MDFHNDFTDGTAQPMRSTQRAVAVAGKKDSKGTRCHEDLRIIFIRTVVEPDVIIGPCFYFRLPLPDISCIHENPTLPELILFLFSLFYVAVKEGIGKLGRIKGAQVIDAFTDADPAHRYAQFPFDR